MADIQPPPLLTPPPFTQALVHAVQAAGIRAEEGQRIFGPIASLWDAYIQSDAVRKLPVKLQKPLLLLCQEMTRTATTHFDAYIKGTKPPLNASPKSYPTGTLTPDTTGSSAPLLPSLSLTYA
jgi:hypothetical protein